MDNDAWPVCLLITVLVLAFGGEPDLIDAIVGYIGRH